MATAHINAEAGSIAKKVIMPGDPLRAKYIAENYLEDAVLVNTTRNMLGYTGKYKGKEITVFASGMGMASMGIYSFELFKFYEVEEIIRVGTSGSNHPEVKLFDIIVADKAYSITEFDRLYEDVNSDYQYASTILNEKLEIAAKNMNINYRKGTIITTDIFNPHLDDPYLHMSKYPSDLGSLASEMEAYALFLIAKRQNKKAACLLTVVDSVYDDKVVSSEDREKALDPMIKMALESCLID